MGRNYWMFVESQENFEITRKMGYTLYGVGPKYRRRAERMLPDDRVLFYVTQMRKWVASATIKSKYFEDRSPIWERTQRGEVLPYRVKLAADIVLDEEHYIDALILAPRLDYLKRWPLEDWPLAFFDSLHLLPQRDFRLVEDEMKRIMSKQRKRERRQGSDDREGGGALDSADAAVNQPN